MRYLLAFLLVHSLLLTPFYSEDKKRDYEHTFEELASMTFIVKSASFYERTVKEAPGSVQVFKLGDFWDTSSRNLADLLSLNATGSNMGVHVRQGELHGVRGLMIDNNAKTLVMVDGLKLNMRQHFGYSASFSSPFLFGDMDRVELINGPTAIQHGSGAINGSINLIPRTGESHPGAEMNMSYGFEDDFHLISMGFGESYGTQRDYYIYMGYLGADGFESEESWGAPPRQDADGDAYSWRDRNYRLSLNWRHEVFSLYGFVQELNPPSNYAEFKNDIHKMSLGLRPKLDFELNDDSKLKLEASFLWHEHANRLPSDGGGREQHWEFKATYLFSLLENHYTALGVSYGEKYFDAGEQFFYADLKGWESLSGDWYETAAFFEDIWEINYKWTVTVGLRLEELRAKTPYKDYDSITGDIEDADPHLSPRLAIAYKIDDRKIVKVSYQHGFRYYDMAYWYWINKNNTAASALGFPVEKKLEPETQDSFEINFSHMLSSKLSYNVNAFYNIYHDQIAWGRLDNIWTPAQVTAINSYNGVTWGGGQFQNLDNTLEIFGGEVEVEYQLLDNTSVDLSYGYAEQRGNDASQKYPSHLLKLHLQSLFMQNKLKVGMNYLYASPLNSEDTPGLHPIYKKDRHIVDIYASYAITKNSTASISVKNLFESDVPPISTRVDQPNRGNSGAEVRRVYLNFCYKF